MVRLVQGKVSSCWLRNDSAAIDADAACALISGGGLNSYNKNTGSCALAGGKWFTGTSLSATCSAKNIGKSMEPDYAFLMSSDNLNHAWESFFAKERSALKRFLVSTLVAGFSFSFIFYMNQVTDYYFLTLTLFTVIFISLYGGIFFGIFFSVVLGLVADYFFIQPIGAVLNSLEAIEHFLIVFSLAVIASYLASSIRTAFRKTILAKQDAERAIAAETAKLEAETAKSLMENVLALVSHDIRNPLGVVTMGSQLILDATEKSSEHQPIVAMMLRNLEHIDVMIESLLDVTRMRAGKTIPLDFQTCDLAVEMSHIIENQSFTESHRIKFTTTDSLWGSWGISGIRRVLQNLITNAVKYGTPGTLIEVQLQKRNDLVLLSVHNQGKEIPLADQQKLFLAFQRTSESEKGPVKGWGLGLALVQGIAEAHGGSVKVESAPHTGTTFTLELPLRNLELTGKKRASRKE